MLLGVAGRDRSLHPWNSTAARAPWEPIIGIIADAAYYVGYAGLSTFDRTLVDIRATRDQWDARLAWPDNCTFTVGKNTQRGVAYHVPNAPAGGVYMRHFRSLP